MKDTKNIRVKNNTLNINKTTNYYIIECFFKEIRKIKKNQKYGRVFGELVVVLSIR